MKQINKPIATVLILLCSGLNVLSQQKVDSLWSVWNSTELPDTTRLHALYLLTWQNYIHRDPDSAFLLAQQHHNYAESKGLDREITDSWYTIGVILRGKNDYEGSLQYQLKALSKREEIGDQQRIARSLNAIGNIYKNQGKYDSAVFFYLKSMRLKEELGDMKGHANTLNNLGSIFRLRGNYAEAVGYYRMSLKISEELEDLGGMATANTSIAFIYKRQKQYKKAIEYFKQSLAIREKLGDKRRTANSLNDLGNVYYNQANYDEALGCYNQSLAIMEQINDSKGIARSLNNIGNIKFDEGKYEVAIDYYERSLKIKEEVGYHNGIAVSLNNLGNTYAILESYKEAIEYNKRSLQVARQYGMLEETMDASEALYDCYKRVGNMKLALEMYELYVSSRDSLLSEESRRDFVRYEFKHEYEKQALADSISNAQAIQVQEALVASEIAKNRRKQQLAYFLYASITLLILILIVLYNRFRVATKRKQIIEEQKLHVDASNNELLEKNKMIQAQSDEISSINRQIKQINESLESRVQERTEKIALQNKKLRNYAFLNSHEVRAPLTKIMGLVDLWNNEGVTKEERTFIAENISKSAHDLDDIIKKLNDLLSEEDLGSIDE